MYYRRLTAYIVFDNTSLMYLSIAIKGKLCFLPNFVIYNRISMRRDFFLLTRYLTTCVLPCRSPKSHLGGSRHSGGSESLLPSDSRMQGRWQSHSKLSVVPQVSSFSRNIPKVHHTKKLTEISLLQVFNFNF